MKCQILFFFKKNKKNIINLSSAEFVHSMVSANIVPVILLCVFLSDSNEK